MKSEFEHFEESMFHGEMMRLLEDVPFREKVRRVLRGLRQPKDSGEYKYARLQLMRLSAPLSAVVVPILAAGLLIVFAKMNPPAPRAVPVTIIEPESIEDLDDIEDILEEPLEPPEPIDFEFTPDTDLTIADPTETPSPPAEFSPQPAAFDSVAMIKSPVIMKGIYGSRNPGARGRAIREFGGSAETEGAVLRALRWLKKNQNPDGSWPNHKAAMTGLALLTFLAHGETPGSEEFGETVEKAIRWLIDHRDKAGGWPRRYEHAIAAYAVCEAYALTRVPLVKEAAEGATEIIIKGQRETGGWRYLLDPVQDKNDDTSCMGWCAQALKAAKMAGMPNEKLDDCMRLAIKGFQKNAHPAGGFGYTAPGRGGLTGVGVLCLQLLGATRLPECRKGLALLEQATFNWEGGGTFNQNYYWYYITQAKFHEGGETWNRWNRLFAPVLVENQTIIKEAIKGPDGKLKDIGFWDMPRDLSGHTDGPVMNTALCALQLQVYYRYLPTYRKPEEIDLEETGLVGSPDAVVDIEIEI